MADKTTTLKTKTNDNVYPNVIGDNRKDAFSDSSTITHHFYDKTHKVGFQIANETNIKIQNSLQKPKGLTKTELVGVGTNGQENIEIGDNLTLANGKLSAIGGGGGGEGLNILNLNLKDCMNEIDYNELISYIIQKTVIAKVYNITLSDLTGVDIVKFTMETPIGNIITTFYRNSKEFTQFNWICTWADDENFMQMITITGFTDTDVNYIKYNGINSAGNVTIYTHFITLTNSTSTFYFTYHNTSNEQLTLFSLKPSLAGKCLLCTGHTDSNTAEYISGEGANIVVGVVNKSDNSTSGITIDSSFTITDLVSPVE